MSTGAPKRWNFDNAVLVAKLNGALKDPKSKLIVDPKVLKRDYSKDRSMHDGYMPDAAVVPATVEEIAAVVKVCQELKVPLTARGAGTGLEGAAIPYAGGVVLETALMRRFELIPTDSVCWVGAAFLKMEFNKLLKPHGFLFGPDPASNPSLGGMASTGGSGMSTIKYGTTRENIVALKVVTAEGNIIVTKQPVRKAATGLDLTQMYCGSEGTLGIICELLVRVNRIPKHRSGGLFRFTSTKAAIDAVVLMRTTTVVSTMVRVELLNAEGVKASNILFQVKLEEVPTLLIELQGESMETIKEEFKTLSDLATKAGCTFISFQDDGEKLDEVWEARRGCYPAAHRFRGQKADRVYMTDVCVPIHQLAASVEYAEAEYRKAGFPCIICAHIGDGNFHCMIPFNTAEEKERMLAVEHRVGTKAIEAGGTVSGEHGIGVGKVKYLRKEHGDDHLDIQRRIKKALDPNGILNPGTDERPKFYAKI